MALAHHRVVVTATGRVRDGIRAQGDDADRVHGCAYAYAHACDLTDPASVREFAAAVAARTDHVDRLVDNGSRYQHGTDLLAASDEDVVDALAPGAAGTVLATKAFLPHLLQSAEPDILPMVSGCGGAGHDRSDAHDAHDVRDAHDAHDASYAARSARAGRRHRGCFINSFRFEQVTAWAVR
ncbi:SDR family NAD(P)-dependent oxidoreductase [Streptomyces virginiae]|uniref:SDR family NAD(P)-dependent oxidoreductase n=1 Tax=Streptomyces virginiae TaxID=1961 RepID=UPI0037013813